MPFHPARDVKGVIINESLDRQRETNTAVVTRTGGDIYLVPKGMPTAAECCAASGCVEHLFRLLCQRVGHIV